MDTEKEPFVKQSNANLFQDKYGILQLAANATLTRTPKSLKITRYLRFKLKQCINNTLTAIQQLWENNSITLSDFMWMEPSDVMYEIIWEKRMQKKRASNDGLLIF